MAEVYKARQLSVGRIVVRKLIRQDHRHRQTYRERFQREAQTVAKLSHPNIVTIDEVQEHAGSPYFTMEYVPGGSLKAKLEASHSHGLPPREAAACLQQVAEAVQYAHERGVLHRDLKPENILVDRDGKPKVSDFGLAKSLESDERLTQTGQQVGTLPYMSPEQISSAVGDVSTRTDVYALGVTLYELLTGELPFRANGLVELHRDILESEPRFSAVEGTRISLDLRTICLKCLEKQPEHRYASAGELAEDLSCYLAGRPIVARRIGPLQRTWRWWARNRAVGTLLIALSVALIAGAATSGYLAQLFYTQKNEAIQKGNLAERQRTLAEQKTAEADQRQVDLERQLRTTRAQRWAADAENALHENPELSLLLAAKAVESKLEVNEPVPPAAQQALHDALGRLGGRSISRPSDGPQMMFFSPNGRWLISGTVDKDNTTASKDKQAHLVRAFDLRGRTAPIQLEGRLVTSKDRKHIAVSKGRTVRVVNLMGKEPFEHPTLLTHDADVDLVRVGPQGRWVVVTTPDVFKYSKRPHRKRQLPDHIPLPSTSRPLPPRNQLYSTLDRKAEFLVWV